MAVPAAAEKLFGSAVMQISRYVDILANRGIEWGLIGPREADRLWDRHVLNSAAMAELPAAGARVLDVGSGAGLPGIPLAIARPDLSVVLLEPLLRRYNFLVEAVAELELGDRVEVRRGRAEDLRESFEVVTARAVAPLGRLVGWTQQLFVPDGELLALKGSSAADEVSGGGCPAAPGGALGRGAGTAAGSRSGDHLRGPRPEVGLRVAEVIE